MMVAQEQAETLVRALEQNIKGCTARERREVQEFSARVGDHVPIQPWELQEFQQLLESIR